MKTRVSSLSISSYVPLIILAALLSLFYLLSLTHATSDPIGGVDLDDQHREMAAARKAAEEEQALKKKKDGHPTVDEHHDHAQKEVHETETSPPLPPSRPRVRLTTAIGFITFELYPEAAPKTVENFLKLVKDGFFGSSSSSSSSPSVAGHDKKPAASFYRAEMHDTDPQQDFCLQGGGWPVKSSPFPPVPMEYKLPNVKYAVSMARGNDPNSATSEFSIMLNDNSKWLAPGGGDKYGYAVFAHVVDGFDLIEKIRKMKKEKRGALVYLKERVEFIDAKIVVI